MNLEWEEGKNQKEKQKEEVSSNSGNLDLTKEQMQKILDDIRAEYPDDIIQPLILKGITNKSNRFYVLKAITIENISEVEDLIAKFEEEEFKNAKASAKKQWLIGKKKENKNISEDNLTEDQANELKVFIDDYIKKNANKIGKRVNEYVVNVIGVLYPKDHAKKVTNKKIPYGDLVMIASSIQVLSGWSEIELDLEAYSDQELSDIYEDLE